jgi:hypothetical protein
MSSHFKTSYRSDKGNVLFMILIAIALFAALSYAVTSSTRVNETTTASEEAQLDQAVMDSYMACINSGRITLRIMHDCTTINYDPPADWGVEPKSCHMFHPEGAGCIYQDLGLNQCDFEGIEITDLEIGEKCGNIVYAGESGGNRIYTTTADQGSLALDISAVGAVAGAQSQDDGYSNTQAFLATGLSSPAIESCLALGNEWYLPAINELIVIIGNKNEGELSGTFLTTTYYLSSTDSHPHAQAFRLPHNILANCWKNLTCRVRCVRRD